MNVKWDADVTTVSAPAYRATIRTGISVLCSNAFTVLAMTAPLAKARLWDAMLAEAGKLGSVAESGVMDSVGVPAFVFLDAYGMRLAIAYGFVPSGVRQRGQTHGEFRLVFMTRDEVPDSLTDVFGLETLWKEVQRWTTTNGNGLATPSSRRKRNLTASSCAARTP